LSCWCTPFSPAPVHNSCLEAYGRAPPPRLRAQRTAGRCLRRPC
jgi:hypothetical protein